MLDWGDVLACVVVCFGVTSNENDGCFCWRVLSVTGEVKEGSASDFSKIGGISVDWYHDDKPRNASYNSKTRKETIHPLKKAPQAIKSAIVAYERKHPTPQTAEKLARCGFAGDRVETDNKPETQEWFVAFDAQCPTQRYKAHTFWLVQQTKGGETMVILADRATEFSLYKSYVKDSKQGESRIAETIIQISKPEKASFRCTRIWKEKSGKYVVSRPANGEYITEIFNSSPGYSMWEFVGSPGGCPVG